MGIERRSRLRFLAPLLKMVELRVGLLALCPILLMLGGCWSNVVVSGRVSSSNDTISTAGAQVVVLRLTPDHKWIPVTTQTANADGEYEFYNLGDGQVYRFQATVTRGSCIAALDRNDPTRSVYVGTSEPFCLAKGTGGRFDRNTYVTLDHVAAC